MATNIGISAAGMDVKVGGAKLVIDKFLNELQQIHKTEDMHFYIFHDQADQLEKYQSNNITNIYVPSLPNWLPRTIRKPFWDQIILPIWLTRKKIDLMLFPKYEKPFFCFKPSVIIVMDLGYLLPGLNAYPFLDTMYKRITIPYSVRAAKAVITISKHTKYEIMRLLKNVDPDKIYPIHIAEGYQDNGQTDHSYVRTKYDIGNKPYIFMSSSMSPRKNVLMGLRGFARIMNKIPHNIVMTGSKSWNNKQLGSLIDTLDLQHRFKRIGFVEDKDMFSVYAEADLYLSPSVYEGFGMTLLEAMHAKTAVVYSEITSHPEVVGDAGMPFDPYDENEISKALLKVASDTKLKHELEKKGTKRVKLFSWKNTTEKILEVLMKTSAELSS